MFNRTKYETIYIKLCQEFPAFEDFINELKKFDKSYEYHLWTSMGYRKNQFLTAQKSDLFYFIAFEINNKIIASLNSVLSEMSETTQDNYQNPTTRYFLMNPFYLKHVKRVKEMALAATASAGGNLVSLLVTNNPTALIILSVVVAALITSSGSEYVSDISRFVMDKLKPEEIDTLIGG